MLTRAYKTINQGINQSTDKTINLNLLAGLLMRSLQNRMKKWLNGISQTFIHHGLGLLPCYYVSMRSKAKARVKTVSREVDSLGDASPPM